MTVITMPSSEKKADNVPLVTNIEIDPSAQSAKDLEAGHAECDRPVKSKFLVLRVINERVYSMWALLYVLLMSLIVLFMMIYGENIYKAVGNALNGETEDDAAFYGTGTIALNDKLTLSDYDGQITDADLKRITNLGFELNNNDNMLNPEEVINAFKEDLELDLKEDSYEKINPVVPLTSSARFIHDFSTNVTGIVDVEKSQCFVMPLNRSSVLPPKSLYDLLFKMSSGYYAVDTSNVLHNMRIVQPPVKDLREYGVYIAKDCAGFPTYKLEKIVSGVFKRSAPTGNRKTFSVFSGEMASFHIVNYNEIDPQ